MTSVDRDGVRHAGARAAACELCDAAGGEQIWQRDDIRVVLVDDPLFPGYCRVVWSGHVREMTDLDVIARDTFMQVVWQVERAIRSVMRPEKINLASLGNLTPHLHWHVIPRYLDDSHFPQPVWGTQQRTAPAAAIGPRRGMINDLRAAIVAACNGSDDEITMGVA